MGIYLNPGNSGFQHISKSNYIDKTGMLDIINRNIGTANNLICNSSPRRFGKSWTAQTLCAYYDCTCDSEELFSGYEIAKSGSFKSHLNNYNVIFLDISGFFFKAKIERKNIKEIIDEITESIHYDLVQEFPKLKNKTDLLECILEYVEDTKKKIIFIIDEWDIIFRKEKNDKETQTAYLNMLRDWFQNKNFTSRAVAAAYLTGIMPIKKQCGKYELPDFKNFTVINPSIFTKYAGFTENEVRKICVTYNMDFEETKKWYERHAFAGAESIYNPFSVMMAMTRGHFRSYWQNTSVEECIKKLIDTNQYGLQEDIVKLIVGDSIAVDINHFKNEYTAIFSKDDILTLLVHLGALVYDPKTNSVKIPNEESRMEFKQFIRCPSNSNISNLVGNSQKLLYDILNNDETAVAGTVKKVHETYYSPMLYSHDQSLKYVIRIAFIASTDFFLKVEELPSSHGIVDVVFIPKRDTALP